LLIKSLGHFDCIPVQEEKLNFAYQKTQIMKLQSFFTGISIILLTSFISCQQGNDENSSGTVILKGKIDQAIAPSILVDLRDTLLEITLNNDGSFTHEIELTNSGLYKLMHGNLNNATSIYLAPDYTCNLKATGANLAESIVFSEDLSIENNYLKEKAIYERMLISQEQESLFTSDELTFIQKIEGIKTKYIDHKKEFQKKNKIFEPYFEELVNMDVEFNIANLKMIYPDYYKFFKQQDTFQVSSNYYSFFQALDIDRELNLNSEQFLQFLPMYLEQKFGEMEKDTAANKTDPDRIKLISDIFMNQKIRETLAYRMMMESFQMHLNDAMDMYPSYMEVAQNEKYRKEIEQLYNQWLPLQKGNKAPNFGFTDINNKVYSLDNFLGKTVYIDVWATWCGPCLRELPYLEALIKEMKNRNDVVIMSVSIDEMSQTWKNMVQSKNMRGNQYHVQGAWQSDLNQQYKISGIPRFILIDKKGNIADANAPRPSSGVVAKLIDEASKI